MKTEKTQLRHVSCEGGSISYLLTRKPVKNINLRIRQDGSVLVSADSRVPVSYIDDLIRKKQSFILSALAQYEGKRAQQDISLRYISGERFRLLGETLVLDVQEAKKECVYVEGAALAVRVRDAEDFRRKELLVAKWRKAYQTEIFGDFVDRVYRMLREDGVNVPYPEVKVRRMTSCWGSCRPDKGAITLNSRLIEMPERCIEYVVLHEFAHFIHPNHSKQFWELVGRYMPDWNVRRTQLRQRG